MDYRDKYLKYKAKYLKLKSLEKSYQTKQMTGGSDKGTIYLFKAEWCGHCRGFKPTWEKLQKDMQNKVNFITYDSEKDANIMKKYNIGGFPTLIMKVGDKAIEYVGSRDYDSLKDFITQYN
jgi:thiol-disulfide isomerase/thioredoxin